MKRIGLIVLSILVLVGGLFYAPQPGLSQSERTLAQPQVITDPSKACQFTQNTLPAAPGSPPYVPVPGANAVTVGTSANFPDPADVVLTFSSETTVGTAGTVGDIAWRDITFGAGGFLVKGPEFFASNTGPFAVKTSVVVFDGVESTSGFDHTFQVGWRKDGGTFSLWFRCLTGTF